MTPLARFPALATFLAAGSTRWPDLGISAAELMAICDEEELSTLVYQRLTESGGADEWPASVREALAVHARLQAGEELLRAVETRAVLGALAHAGARPILIKGTPLAYGWYGTPASRPRTDTDVLIPAGCVDAARTAMAALGYVATVHCHDLFSQFEVQRVDPMGVTHAFDVHWKISTQAVFAGMLTYDELLPRTVPVPALGDAAIAPDAVDGLLLSCVHPVMHHRNAERALWLYDIHLLTTAIGPARFDEFAERALDKKVGAICAHGLRRARMLFQTAVPDHVLATLAAAGPSEPSAEYLASDRKWHHELMASARELSTFGARTRLFREVLFPSPRYMLGAYGLRGKPLASWLLPVLYVHRNLYGAWKVVSGQK